MPASTMLLVMYTILPSTSLAGVLMIGYLLVLVALPMMRKTVVINIIHHSVLYIQGTRYSVQ